MYILEGLSAWMSGRVYIVLTGVFVCVCVCVCVCVFVCAGGNQYYCSHCKK